MAPKREPLQDVSILEWVASLTGVLLALAMLGLIAWEAATGTEGLPPALTVEPVSVSRYAGGYVLEVKVRNHSDETAAAVGIEGRLGDETSTATLSYVPGRADRSAGLVFSSDPRAGVRLRALGYEEP